MSTARVSKDKHWTVSVISSDDMQRIRVEHDTTLPPGGRAVPVHSDGARRRGTVRTARGFLVADLTSAADVARYVSPSELEEVQS